MSTEAQQQPDISILMDKIHRSYWKDKHPFKLSEHTGIHRSEMNIKAESDKFLS